LQLKKYENAVNDAKKSTYLDKGFIKGYFRAAQALTMLGKLSEAERECRMSLEVNPNNAEIAKEREKITKISEFITKGNEYLEAKNYADAQSEYDSALALAPQSIQFKIFKAEALIGQGKYKEVTDMTE